jgi:phosphoserine phosphatase
VPLAQTVAIGDGANDLDMLERAGWASPSTRSRCAERGRGRRRERSLLDTILYLLGISREEVETADAEAGTPTRAPGGPLKRPTDSSPR